MSPWLENVVQYWFPLTGVLGGALTLGKFSQSLTDVKKKQASDDTANAEFRKSTQDTLDMLRNEIKSVGSDVSYIRGKLDGHSGNGNSRGHGGSGGRP